MAKSEEDINGFTEYKDNKLSKPGIFDYLGSEVGQLDNPDKIFKVYRSKEELQSKECIDSFKLQPWIIDHKMLGKKYNSPAEKKGIHGVIGQDVYFDKKDNWLKGNIKTFSDTLEEEMDEGKEDLSLGFSCKYKYKPGIHNGERYDILQTEIRGNHLALVDDSRMNVAVMDSSITNFAMDKMSIKFNKSGVIKMAAKDNKEKEKKDEKNSEEEKNYGNDNEAVELSEIKGMLKELLDKIGNGKDEDMDKDDKNKDDKKDEDMGKKSKDNKGKDMDNKDGMDSSIINKRFDELSNHISRLEKSMEGMDATTLMKEVENKNQLADTLSNFIGTFDHSSKSLQQVAEYGVEKLKIDCDKADSIPVLRGYLQNRPIPSQNLYSSGFDGNSYETTIKGNELIDNHITGEA